MKFEGNFNKIKAGLKTLAVGAVGIGSLSAKEAVDINKNINAENTEIHTENNLNTNLGIEAEKTIELSGEYMAFLKEFEGLEVGDTLPTQDVKYGFKKLGTLKIFKQTIEVDYYGSEKTSHKGPFFMKQNKDDVVYELGDVFPHMGGHALFYNFGPDGVGHLVELSGKVKVIRDKNGEVYATVCGNLLKLVAVEEKVEEKKEKEDISEIKMPEIKQEIKKDWTDFGQNNNPFSNSNPISVGYGIAVGEKTIYTGKEIDPTYESWGDIPSWGDYLSWADHPSWGSYCAKYGYKQGHGKECSCGKCKSWFNIHVGHRKR